MSTTIDPTTSGAAGTSGQSSSSKSNALGQDAFMNLLVTQLQHQDPTQPQDDSQFIAQLAQFSSLDQLTQMNATLSQIASFFLQVQSGGASTGATTDGTTNSNTQNTSNTTPTEGTV